MRVFVGSFISDALRWEIDAWTEEWNALPVRWLQGRNLHVTLVPPWEAAALAKIEHMLGEVTHGVHGPIPVSFHTVRYGPDSRAPRLIWAEGDAPRELVALRAELHSALSIPLDPRPFRLHLTLARFRPDEFARFPTNQLQVRVAWHETIHAVALIHSRLLPGGAEYEPLIEFPILKT